MNTLPSDTTSPNKAVILIVDSDPLTLTATSAALYMVGYECHGAADSEAALKAARRLSLDLVICDVHVQGESGLMLCGEIKRQDGMADVPIMFVSANQLPDIIRRAYDTGGAYFLRKPFDPRVMLELVEKALWMPHLVESRTQPSQSLVPSV